MMIFLPPKLIIFDLEKHIFFPKTFSWLEQRASGVTVGGFKKNTTTKILLFNTYK